MRCSKAQKTIIENEVYNLLCAHTEEKEIYDTICHKYKILDRQFKRYMKLANEKLTEQQRAINAQVMSETTSAMKERLKTALWTQEEILFKLQDEASRAKRLSDKINAIKLICDIQGFKAPVRNEIEFMQLTPVFEHNPLLNGIDTDKQNKLLTA